MRIFAAFLTFVLLLWHADSASAVSIAGRNELQLQVTLLGIVRTTRRDPDAEEVESRTVQGGLSPRLGFGFGRAFNEHTLLHLMGGVAFANTRLKVDDEELSAHRLMFEFTPSLRYVASGQNVRFFVGGGFSLGTERVSTDEAADEVHAVSFAVGPMLGFHGFLTEHVSLDPAFELGWIGTSSESVIDEVTTTASGVRMFITLSLTAWLRPKGPSHALPEPTPAVVVPAAPRELTTTGQLNFEGFGVYLSGRPERRGDVMYLSVRRLTRGSAEWKNCGVELLGEGMPAVPLQVAHDLVSLDFNRYEESLEGAAPIGLLERWAEAMPRFSICGQEQPVNPNSLMNLKSTLRTFKKAAVRAGTYPVEQAQHVGPAEAAPLAPVTREQAPAAVEAGGSAREPNVEAAPAQVPTTPTTEAAVPAAEPPAAAPSSGSSVGSQAPK